MRFIEPNAVYEMHRRAITESGGSAGIRDIGALESALAQPRMTFGGEDLYPTLIEKVAALGYSLIMNHPFVDGNKRVGYAAMETMLMLNGLEIQAAIDDAEQMTLNLAAGQSSREELIAWLQTHTTEFRMTD